MRSRCTGVLLAGGSSTRFGGIAKGLLALGGRRVVDWTIDALAQASDELLLISNDAEVRSALPDLAARSDVRAERGSLIGLHSALAYCDDAALVVAWDMPFVSSQLLASLRAMGERAGSAAIPEGAGGLEPLCGYYPKACLDVAERQLAEGEMRLSAFVDALSHRAIMPLHAVRRFGAPERLFANLNTPDDFAAAQSLMEHGHPTLEPATPRHSR
ncbi:MAG TPA: molybdenum cofactor guanylyltransferase [Gemmatimonadaceae bacterium]|nr:molybdenum cofactor guanylyltransferase [Gemmatimonadaceae bacterium]